MCIRDSSTPATTGVDSTLRIRHRGDFRSLKSSGEAIFPCPLPHLRRMKLTHRAGQVCRLFLSPKKSTSAAGVLVTTCCYVLGPGHGLECSTPTSITHRDIPLHRLSCLVYYCLVCCLPPASCRPEQDTPILALPRRRRRRCTRIAFGCAQDIRTTNEGRLYHFTYYHEELLYLVSAYRPVLHQQSERETCL